MGRTSIFILVLFVVIGLAFGMISLACADCPDLVMCNVPEGYYGRNVGYFSTPTCYKFLLGCRPWHCEGNSTNQDYWDQECRRRFPKGCTKENGCVAEFPLRPFSQ
jgi:hypothetical protein